MPDGVIEIKQEAFEDCDTLEKIVIPKDVVAIRYGAFDGCSNLKTVYYTGSKEEWGKISIGQNNSEIEDVTIVYNYKPKQ